MDNQEIKKIQKRLPVSEYNNLLSKIELKDIYLKDSKISLFSRDIGQGTNLTFKEETKIVLKNDNQAVFEVIYNLKAKNKSSRVFDSKVVYAVLFDCSEELSEDFLTLFKYFTLPLNTFPYFREFINSMVSRMGIPPLVLPLRKNLIK